jgi:hypothetical protein
VRVLQQATVDAIGKRFAPYPRWGFKDPRTIRVLPFWQSVFRELGVADRYVVIVRNPLSTARSLLHRDGFPFERTFLMWLVYMIPHLHSLRGPSHRRPDDPEACRQVAQGRGDAGWCRRTDRGGSGAREPDQSRAGQCVPALRPRPVVRATVQAPLPGRSLPDSVCRRLRGLLPVPGGCERLRPRACGANAGVRPGAETGEDPPAAVLGGLLDNGPPHSARS